MEMERINDNLIKVLIDTDDLAERGINFLDLIGDQNSIEKFFYSILEEVDVDQHFQESEAVTFQVMPRKDGLELYISRNNFDEMETIWEDEITKRLLEHKQAITDQAIDENSEDVSDVEEDKIEEPKIIAKKEIQVRNIKFNDLEAFLSCAKSVNNLIKGENSLYHYREFYYLIFNEPINVSTLSLENPIWSILEYGELTNITSEVLAEHGNCIRVNDAVDFFCNNF